jgi:hypothetical protein
MVQMGRCAGRCEKAGDKAGAAAARDALLKLYQRNAMHLIVRSRLTQPTS